MTKMIHLPDCERVQGLHTQGGPELAIQWTALPAARPGQSPSTSALYELKMPAREAWRLLEFLAQAWRHAGEPTFPKDS